jgi:hypothetical protein
MSSLRHDIWEVELDQSVPDAVQRSRCQYDTTTSLARELGAKRGIESSFTYGTFRGALQSGNGLLLGRKDDIPGRSLQILV